MIHRKIILTVSGRDTQEVTGKIIALLRIAKGWSQQNLGDKVGYCRSTVRMWEQQGVKKESQLIAIAQVFGVPTSYLTDHAEDLMVLVKQLIDEHNVTD